MIAINNNVKSTWLCAFNAAAIALIRLVVKIKVILNIALAVPENSGCKRKAVP